MKKNNVLRLTESAIMIAFAVVLSTIKLIDMPHGGSVTLCSMLPIAFLAYRYGFAWGAFSSVVYSLLQLLLGADNLSYVTSATAVIMVILLDYVLAFTGYSFAGLFTKSKLNQTSALVIAIISSGVFRFLCHTVSGYVVWRDLTLPTNEAWIGSITYNALYMIPEIVTTVIAGVCLSKIFDFRNEKITTLRSGSESAKLLPYILSVSSKVIVAAGTFWASVIVLSNLHDGNGNFDISGIANVNWIYVVSVLAATVVLSLLLIVLKRINMNKSN